PLPRRGEGEENDPLPRWGGGEERVQEAGDNRHSLTEGFCLLCCLLITQQTDCQMKNETRERLIEAARVLFLKQGYASTGIAQILEAADAGSGSLYYFFPTKEDLLLAVLEWYKAHLMPIVVQPVYDRVSDPIERIFGILA